MKRLLTLPLLLAFLATAGAEEPIKLRYQFDKDQPLIYRTVVEENKTQTINNNDIATTTRMADVALRTAESVDDDGNFQMRNENKRLSVKVTLNGADAFEFDSTSEERDRGSALGAALTPLYDRLNGAFLDYSFSPRGKVLKVKNFRELVGDVIKDQPVAALMLGGGSDEMAKLGLAGQFAELPDEPVSPGDSWEVPYDLKLPKFGTLKGKTTYTYDGTETNDDRTLAKITIGGELAFDLEVKVDGAGTVSGNLSSNEYTGTAHFDAAAGRLEGIKSTLKLSGNMNLTTADGKNIAIRLEQTAVTTSERLDKLPE